MIGGVIVKGGAMVIGGCDSDRGCDSDTVIAHTTKMVALKSCSRGTSIDAPLCVCVHSFSPLSIKSTWKIAREGWFLILRVMCIQCKISRS